MGDRPQKKGGVQSFWLMGVQSRLGSEGGSALMLVGALVAMGERSQSNGFLESGLLVGELGGEGEGRGAGSAHREGSEVVLSPIVVADSEQLLSASPLGLWSW